MNNFDPFARFEQIIPAQWMHRLIRAGAMAVVLGFLVLRIRHFDNYTFKPLWLAETALFSVLATAFMVRRDPVDRSRGAAEIIVPLIGSVLPFGLLLTQQSVWSRACWSPGGPIASKASDISGRNSCFCRCRGVALVAPERRHVHSIRDNTVIARTKGRGEAHKTFPAYRDLSSRSWWFWRMPS